MAMPRDSESFRRYDLNLAQVAASVEDLFDYDRNRREYEQAKFFLPVPLQGTRTLTSPARCPEGRRDIRSAVGHCLERDAWLEGNCDVQ
ncbi:hypothetical protein Ae201684P_010580 [Aphanomyces euteiches]|nr:hypothetical protein Ae201684P_010580 [Aphanomyces euteiches]